MSGSAFSFVRPALRSFQWRMTPLVLGCKSLVKRRRVSIRGWNAFFMRPECRFLRWPRRIEAGSMTITVYPLYQAGQHPANFVQRGIESLVLLFCEQTKIARKQEKILQLTRGTSGNIQKLTKLGLAATTTALRNVRWDRSCSSPHLAGNAVPFGIRKRAGCHVDAQHERVALLPNPELLKVLHRTPDVPSPRVYLQLITKYCQLAQGMPC
jgi:hypothetical protein